MTKSEELVYEFCNKTFLSLWSFANPIGKKGKELCDIIVVCEPDILIFSVKEINMLTEELSEILIDRWNKRAIYNSVKQIYGAERFLLNSDSFLLKDRINKIEIKKNIKWKIHRIAVCYGRGEKFPLKFGDFGKGFVHVFDEKSFRVLMSEFDTIKDLIGYFKDKEKLVNQKREIVLFNEENLIAYYIYNDYSFPEGPDCIVLLDNIWEELKKNKSYIKSFEELKISYVWDNLIETLINDFHDDRLINLTKRDDLELVLRQMARERRLDRKFLSIQFLEFIGYFNKTLSKSRILKSPNDSEVQYLFLLGSRKERELRIQELHLRCYVARYLFECKTIIGIATEEYSTKGFSLDFVYFNAPVLTEEMKDKAINIQNELGYYKNANTYKI